MKARIPRKYKKRIKQYWLGKIYIKSFGKSVLKSKHKSTIMKYLKKLSDD